jgi:uncharacterized membrane protein YciS (DUF1049 family)
METAAIVVVVVATLFGVGLICAIVGLLMLGREIALVGAARNIAMRKGARTEHQVPVPNAQA